MTLNNTNLAHAIDSSPIAFERCLGHDIVMHVVLSWLCWLNFVFCMKLGGTFNNLTHD